MSKTSCEITFENNNTNRVYFSGDTINGTVIITLQKEKIVKGAFACNMRGMFRVHFTHSTDIIRNKRSLYSFCVV